MAQHPMFQLEVSKAPDTQWECPRCTLRNSHERYNCEACRCPKPGYAITFIDQPPNIRTFSNVYPHWSPQSPPHEFTTLQCSSTAAQPHRDPTIYTRNHAYTHPHANHAPLSSLRHCSGDPYLPRYSACLNDNIVSGSV